MIGWSEIGRDVIRAKRTEKSFFVGYIVLCSVALAVALLPVRLPAQLIDGPYVAKHDMLGVRIQYMTGNLPTDNSLPHVVTEYLLRDISFQEERPIMPGQEVTNRPILAPLVIVPFRAAFYLPVKLEEGLPKFNYVGSSWPDFSFLMKDETAYLSSLAIGISLNALLLVALGAFAIRLPLINPYVATGTVAVFVTSPYFLFQTLYTWPKSLAAFFVLFAIILYDRLKLPILAGVSFGLAYLSHPYAVVFFCCFGLYLLYQGVSKYLANEIQLVGLRDLSVKTLVKSVAAFAAITLPWFLWSKFYLDIPSDLIAQNFFQPGQQLLDSLWMRPVNFFNTLLPTHLLAVPFDITRILIGGTVTAAGAVGILIYFFGVYYLVSERVGRSALYVLQIYLPTTLLIFVFSNQAVPALHGLQGPFALLTLLGVLQLYKSHSAVVAFCILGAQVMLNIGLFVAYFSGLF